MSSATASTKPEIFFTTLGMFILDEIHPLPPSEAQLNVIGGAGTYSALGARLFCPPPLSRSVGWIVDAGDDFPDEVRETIDEWETGCVMRKRHGKTTRGWNGYGEREVRGEFLEFVLSGAECSKKRCSVLILPMFATSNLIGIQTLYCSDVVWAGCTTQKIVVPL